MRIARCEGKALKIAPEIPGVDQQRSIFAQVWRTGVSQESAGESRGHSDVFDLVVEAGVKLITHGPVAGELLQGNKKPSNRRHRFWLSDPYRQSPSVPILAVCIIGAWVSEQDILHALNRFDKPAMYVDELDLPGNVLFPDQGNRVLKPQGS